MALAILSCRTITRRRLILTVGTKLPIVMVGQQIILTMTLPHCQTPSRRSIPSRTPLTRSLWSRTTKQAGCSSTDQGGGKRIGMLYEDSNHPRTTKEQNIHSL